MDYTKEEFREIVNQFNVDKERYNWMYLINENVRNWERAKKKIINYPSYYNFISAREFRYWLLNSEKENFVEDRFCPVCGKFIPVQEFGFQGHYKVACEKHVEEIRMKNVQDGMMKKYGFITPGKSKEVWEKVKQTNIEKYGVEFPLQDKNIHKKTIEKGNENGSYMIGSKKGKETKKERYGDENYNNRRQISKTKINQPEYIKKDIQEKCYCTKKQNQSFNISKPEDKLYESLVEVFVDVKRQYRSTLYPFACDYYLPEYDMYIEYQGFEGHGKHPFDSNNLGDLKIVEKWKQKSKELNWKGEEKELYKNFIQVWTCQDPLKRKIAKENNLNFLEIFPDDFNNDCDSIVEYIHNRVLKNCSDVSNGKIELMKDIPDEWKNEEIFGITKGQCLSLCLTTPFPGTLKWPADNPIWDCNVAKSISPKEGYSRVDYLVKAINNLYWILNKSINENRYADFVNSQKQKMLAGGIDLVRVIVNRFTIAKICPKVTALMPSKFLQIIEDSGIDISCGVYCPMAGFGGIIEGAKRWFEEHGIDSTDKIEAYDINPNFCKYYGWIQRDVLAQKVKTDKVVFVCPPFGLKTERWLGTPEVRNDGFETNYLDFHDWCKLIREYINAPNYIFVGPEESGIRENKNINSGLFTKQFGIRWYSEYSN